MAIELSKTIKALKEQTNLKQQIILKINGFTECFGAVAVKEILKYGTGHKFGDPGLTYGGLVDVNGSKDFIMLNGTTTQITSQVNIEDGLPNSISRFSVSMIDKNSELSTLFRPGNIQPDMLGLRAEIYITFQGGAFPEDATRIFIGIIDEINFPAGECKLSISSPEKFRQNEIFTKANTNLDGAINDSITTITVDSTSDFIDPVDIIQSYIKIGDELMEISSSTATTFTVTRGALGTTSVSAENNDDIESFYRLTGNAIEMALKLMMSGGDEFFETGAEITAFNQITPTNFIQNSIFFPNIPNIEDEFGLTEGDIFTVEAATIPGNNVSLAIISGFGIDGSGSYIITTSTLTTDTAESATAKFKSQYNVLPAAASFQIEPRFIDVEQFQNINAQNSSFFVDYDLYVKDTVSGEDFIASKILFPSGVLSTIRKARTSAVFLSPPVVTNLAPVVNQFNLEKPDGLVLKRSINDNFYNAIVYRFNQSVLDDKFLAGEVTQSADSTNRIKVPNKSLTIDAPGLRDNIASRSMLTNVSERFLQRYRFGAESLEVFINYRDGFNLDLRDAVVVDGENLSIANTINGTRGFNSRVMQIFNRQLNLKTGIVKLLLVDSIYNTGARYVVVAPGSLIDSSATTTKIPLKRSFSTSELDEENEKWSRLIGQNIRVRNVDFTFNEETTLNGFVLGELNTMSVDALSVAPGEDYIVELADYDESSDDINDLAKTIHGSFNRQLTVLAGLNSTSFTVSGASELTENTKIRIHSQDFTSDSSDVEITDITGSTITVDDMGFTPTSSDLVDRISYTDGGDPYLYL